MSWLNKFFKFREKSDGDIVKPFLEHMEDLRWVILKMVMTLIACMSLSFFWQNDMLRLLRAPLHEVAPLLEKELVIVKITDAFMISIELALFAGIAISLPFLIYFLASFILPALTRQEKKFLLPGILGSTTLFVMGVLVSYEYILPKTLKFFYEYTVKRDFRIMWTWSDYFSFASWLTIGLGLLCQLPIVVIVLAIVGVIDYHFLARTRSYAIAIILVLTVVVAPTPDPLTFLSLGTPVVALYELCIWVVWLMDRRKRKRREREAEVIDDHRD